MSAGVVISNRLLQDHNLNALLMTYWLCLPLAPLNPIQEDTLLPLSLHFAVGVSNPNGIVTAGPLLAANCEMLIIHPLMVRGTAEFKYNQVSSHLFPRGNLWAGMFGVDAIYYRGTNFLTGYIGGGAVYALHNFRPFQATADSLFLTEGITAVDMRPEWGYRLILGLRYHKSYSLEISVVELRPKFIKIARDNLGGEARSYQTTRTSSFQFALGYLFRI